METRKCRVEVGGERMKGTVKENLETEKKRKTAKSAGANAGFLILQ